MIYKRDNKEIKDQIDGGSFSSTNGSGNLIYRDGFYIEKMDASTNTEQAAIPETNENLSKGPTRAVYHTDLYAECKRQLSEMNERFGKVNSEYEDLVNKYRNQQRANKDDFETMTLTYKNAALEKDELVKSLRETIQSLTLNCFT